jgi:hypothetical protein
MALGPPAFAAIFRVFCDRWPKGHMPCSMSQPERMRVVAIRPV